MKEQRIIIEIDPDGQITAEAEGFTGDACLKDLERLLAGLAPGAASIARKPDTGASRVVESRTAKIGRKP